MEHHVLIYDVVDNFAERRAPYRDEHLRLVHDAHARGDLLLAGALGDPPDRALLVFRAERAAVEAFARRDPYVLGGLVRRWEVQPWAIVTGQGPAGRPVQDRAPVRPLAGAPVEIARIWTARTTAGRAPGYADHLRTQVLPRLRALDGYRGTSLLRRHGEDQVELIVITRWRSLESVRAFAGADLEAAVVEDEAASLLTRYDRRVRHYDVVAEDHQSLDDSTGDCSTEESRWHP